MGIAKKSDYALRAMYELALRDRQSPAKIHDIAQSQEIPPRFLEGILNELKHAGLLDSRRGSEGGYWLLRSPQEVTVADVISVVEGPLDWGRPGRVLGGNFPVVYPFSVFATGR